jgi:hypothetical protein
VPGRGYVTELAGFLTSSPCELTESTRRFGDVDDRALAFHVLVRDPDL